MPRVLSASDMSAPGSKTGWPPTSQETLNNRLFPVTSGDHQQGTKSNMLKEKYISKSCKNLQMIHKCQIIS